MDPQAASLIAPPQGTPQDTIFHNVNQITQNYDPVSTNLFARRVYYAQFIQCVYNLIVAWCLVGCKDNETFHPETWGLDLGLLALWIAVNVCVACFGKGGFRSAPIVWIMWIAHVLLTGYLVSAAMAYFGDEYVFYIVAIHLAVMTSMYAASVTSKGWVSFGGSALFNLAGIFIMYEIFLIFTSISLTYLIIVGVCGVILGLYLNYVVQTTLLGFFYGLNPEKHEVAGSIIIWTEVILSPVRVCEIIGRNMRAPTANVAKDQFVQQGL